MRALSYLSWDLYLTMTYQPYSIAKHTILSLLYTVIHPRSFSFLLRDPATSSLILLPTESQRSQLQYHIANIQNKFDCKLTHSFASYDQGSTHSKIFNEEIITPAKQGELKPLLLGQLSVCYIKAAGYRPDYHLIAITHISSSSTKFAVLFTGKMLSFWQNTIDLERQAKASDYSETLNKLKFFPNQTLLFPQQKARLQDFQFSQALEKNAILEDKIQKFKNGGQAQNSMVFTSILEEKIMNPFLSPQKFSSLFKANDRNSSFQMLRKTRLQWKNDKL